MECGQSYTVPAQRSGPLILIWIILFFFAICCGRTHPDPPNQDATMADPYPEIPYTVSRHKVNHDSLTVIPANAIRVKAGKKNVIPYKGIRTRKLHASMRVELDPSMISVFTPGRDSVPQPREYILTEPTETPIPDQHASGAYNFQHGEKIFSPVRIPVKHPEPLKALPLRMSEKAGGDIQYLGREKGLPSSGASRIFSDSKGKLWFGQWGAGVCIYDGTFLSIYGEDEGYGKGLLSFYEDSKGHFWMGNWQGVARYDGQSFTHFFGDELGGGMAVLSIAEDKTGAMWFGSNRGLLRFYRDTLTLYTEREGLTSNVVHALEIDHEGNIWAGTNKGMARFDGTSFTQFHGCEGFQYSVFDLMEDRNKNLWMGTPNGAFKMDKEAVCKYDGSSGLSGKWFWSIEEDSDGNIWLGGPGVNKICGNTVTQYTMQEGLKGHGIRSILEDRNHHIWLGSGEGLIRIRDNSFSNLAQLVEIGTGVVTSVFENQEGQLCFTILGSGLYTYNGKRFESLTMEEGINGNTRSAFEDEEGDIWMSTFAGLQEYDGEYITKYVPNDGDTLHRNIVKCIYRDKKKQIWLGFWNGGLMKFNGHSFTSFHRLWNQGDSGGTLTKKISSEHMVSIQEDSHGNLWYATASQGLFKYDGDSLHRYSSGPHTSFFGINSMIIDGKDHIWLGTGNGGVLMFDGNTFIQISKEVGLGSVGVSSLVEDHMSNIWAGSSNGLYRISTQKKGQYPISYFGGDHGLKDPAFNQNVACLDSRNRLWWGTDYTLTTLDLNTYRFPMEQAVIQLNNLQINEEQINFSGSDIRTKGISYSEVAPFSNYPVHPELSFDKNNLIFTYSALYLSGRQELDYQYMLEGLDEQWSQKTRENSVNFRNIPPGKYKFKVKAIVRGDVYSEVFEYPFTILRPWWASWYSFAFYAIMLIIMMRYYVNFIAKRERLKADYKIKQLEVEKMQELDTLKSSFFASVSHEFRTPLTLLLGPVNELLAKGTSFKEYDRKLLKIMKRNTRRLHQLINQLLDISRLESGKMKVVAYQGDLTVYVRTISNLFLSLAESRQIDYQIDLENPDMLCVFDRDKIEKIITNLLSNAFKYTPLGGSVALRLEYIHGENGNQASSARLRVEDSGRGIPEQHISKIFDRFHQVESSDTRKDASMGIGLSLTKELVTLLNGSLEVASTVGEGSVFSVILPLSRDNFANCEWEMPDEDSEKLIMADGIPVHLESLTEQNQIIPVRQKNGNPELLIVEDNQDLREFISQKLDAQYRIIEAVNGKEGMQMALDRIPDIIISDLMMPVMGGEKMCGYLKEDPKTSHIPIIILTAKADKRSKLKGLETGADDYIIKPFDTEELLARVRNLIEQREKLRQKFRRELVMKSDEPLPVSPRDHLLQRILEILEQHISDSEFHMDALSKDLGMSRAQLYRKVQAMTGFTPNDLLRKIRLKKAAELFDHGHDNVSQVMYQVGFNNQSYFAKIFREVYYKTPTQYLKASSSRETTH